MPVKVRGFIDDTKKDLLHFMKECLWFTELPKVFISVSFDGVCI